MNKNLKELGNLLEKISNKELKKEELIPYLNIDTEVEAINLDWRAFQEINNFAPFGEGNPAPLFLLRQARISEIRSVGSSGNHLKLSLEKELGMEIKRFKAIGFGLADFCDKIRLGDKIDVVFELIANEWNGTKELQLKIIDLKRL